MSLKDCFPTYSEYIDYLQWFNEQKLNKPDFWKIERDTWYIYRYGNGVKVVYNKFGREAPKEKIEKNKKPLTPEEKNERLSQSISRTKSKIFELAFCNEFSYFCTFTQNKEFVGDRFNLFEFRKDLAQFVRNQNRTRADKIFYLLIPEQHEDGAWHMHGLLSGLTAEDLREFSLEEKIPYSIRNQLLKGEKVYNWEKYSRKFGFFTASPIKSHEACCKYITKYITKDVIKNNLEKGAHSYFASQGLKRRELICKDDRERCPIDKWGFENDYIKTAWFDTEEDFWKSVFSDFEK